MSARESLTHDEQMFRVHMGRNLRKLRGTNSLALLAKEAGISEGHLRQIEAGNVTMSLWTAYRLALALGCALDEFFEGVPDILDAP